MQRVSAVVRAWVCLLVVAVLGQVLSNGAVERDNRHLKELMAWKT